MFMPLCKIWLNWANSWYLYKEQNINREASTCLVAELDADCLIATAISV